MMLLHTAHQSNHGEFHERCDERTTPAPETYEAAANVPNAVHGEHEEMAAEEHRV
jgi:hypothetical protein